MAKQQTIKYAPQWNNMTVDNVTFQTNNVMEKLLPIVPQWSIKTSSGSFGALLLPMTLFPSTDETEQHPLREFLIKFLVLNGQRPLTLDINTFCSSIVLDYNNGKYVDHPTPEAVKKELVKIANNPSYLDKTPILKNSFPMAWRILFTFVIQVLGGNYSSTEQVNSIRQLLACSLITGTEVDIGEISYSDIGPKIPGALSKKRKRPKSKRPPTKTKGTRKSKPLPENTATHPKELGGNKQPLDRDLTSTTSDEGTAKITPRPEGSLRDKDSRGNIPPADMEPVHPPVDDLLRTGAGKEIDEEPHVAGIAETHHQSPLPQANKPQSSYAPSTEASDTESCSDDILRKYDNTLPLIERQLVKYLRKMSKALFTRISEDNWENHEEAAVNYADLKASIDDYYDENIAHRDQTDKLVEASMNSLDKSNNTISDLYKCLNIITKLLKEIKNAVKDDFACALKQDEELVAWTKSSTNMEWNLSSRLSGLERAQNHIHVTPTLALTHIPANVEGEKTTNTATEDPHSYTEGGTGEPKRAIPISTIQPTQAQSLTTIITHRESSQVVPKRDKGKGIATESDEDLK
ncbi:hypothetical protein Tco_0052691 [Tanacetum coccineum]